MKKILIPVILLALVGCKKDYSVNPSPFQIGDKVELNGINPRASFTPYDCCSCPCTITKAYTVPNQIYWFYDIVDLNNTPLTHVDNKQLKKY